VMKPANVDLHIHELVLHGLAPGDRHRIGEAVRRELMRLLTEHGMPPRSTAGNAIDRADGGAFEVRREADSGVIGRQIANSVYRTLRSTAASRLPECSATDTLRRR